MSQQSHFECTPKRIKTRDVNRYLNRHVFATLFTIDKKWKQPVDINNWMHKQSLYTYRVEDYST